jgi:hypothetical protein
MKRINFLASAFLVLAVYSVVSAADVKGELKISSLQGASEVKVAGKEWEAAKAGMTLHQGDIIRTKQGGWVYLDMRDGKKEIASVELKENSELRLTKLEPEKGILFDLALGEALIRSQKLNSGKAKFEVKTPTSFIEVVGKATFSVTVEKIE